ncbi:MAG: asparaginase domain-containing protein [Parcubacteria group bacterium]
MKRQTIALLFCGGTQLTNRPNRWERVMKPKDAAEWLDHVPELNIVADIVPHFIAPSEDSNIGIDTWRMIADYVRANVKSVDGVLVLHSNETIHYAANALSLMMRNLPIPVVLSGSPIRTGAKGEVSVEFGARANVINALQVATSDIAEVCVVFGNRIMRGSRVQLELIGDALHVTTVDRSLLGRIDFGISLDRERIRRTKRTPVFRSAIDPNVFTMTTAPGSVLPIRRAVEAGIHAILVRSAQDFLALTAEQIGELQRAARSGIPVVVASPQPMKTLSKEFMPLVGVSSSMAVVKTMWAIGFSKKRSALQRVLAQNVAGEHVYGGGA